MPKFIPHGKVSAPFQGYKFSEASEIGHQHTGQDEYKGYGRPWMSDNDGIVYKVYYPTASFDWAAVHMLVPDGEDWCEVIPLGHASKITVREGDFVHKGQLVGYEGNHGLVYSNGRKVSVEERIRGSRVGAHNHRGIRPIKLVDEAVQDGKSFYLTGSDGKFYKHNGKYCKIKINNPDTKGWVDPMSYYPQSARDRLELLALNKTVEGDYKTASIYTLVRAFIS